MTAPILFLRIAILSLVIGFSLATAGFVATPAVAGEGRP